MQVVLQEEIARVKGCGHKPSSCMVRMLLEEAGMEPRGLAVVDTTYGEGRFYLAWRPRLLLGCDVRILDWKVEPDLFARVPSWGCWRRVGKLGIKPDLVVVDPPFSDRGHKTERHGRPWYNSWAAVGGKRNVLQGGFITAEKLQARYVLVHYNERVKHEGWRIIAEKWWRPRARHLNLDNTITWWGVLARG